MGVMWKYNNSTIYGGLDVCTRSPTHICGGLDGCIDSSIFSQAACPSEVWPLICTLHMEYCTYDMQKIWHLVKMRFNTILLKTHGSQSLFWYVKDCNYCSPLSIHFEPDLKNEGLCQLKAIAFPICRETSPVAIVKLKFLEDDSESIADPHLGHNYLPHDFRIVTDLALKCTAFESSARPSMRVRLQSNLLTFQ
eukprot:Gb_39455 [translate_table: standard]